ncbi:colanic acid exporter [compost metagenome]
MLATVVASGLYTLVSPIFDATYPRLSALAARNPSPDLISTYRLASGLLASLLFPLAMFLAFTGRSLIQLWTGDSQLAEAVSPVLALLSIGSALHGMMFMPHALALASGASALVLRTNVILLLAFGPLIAILTTWQGGVGAALGWVILHAAYLLFGSIYTHRKLLPQISTTWLLRDLGIPGVVSVSAAMAGFTLARMVAAPPLHDVTIGAATMLGAWAVLLVRQPTFRQWLYRTLPADF